LEAAFFLRMSFSLRFYSLSRFLVGFLTSKAAFVGAFAADWKAPEQGWTRPPQTAEVAELARTAERVGWPEVGARVLGGSLVAYGNSPADAERIYPWLLIGRWSTLWGESEADFIPRWVDAVNHARVGHRNMAVSYLPQPQALGVLLRPEFKFWLLTHTSFSQSFFELLSPCDYLPQVLAILDHLHQSDPLAFETYAQLALAIALVYDVPPPPGWPHGQVSETVLPRRLPEARELFDFFVKADRSGRLLQRVAHLKAAELIFLVDIAVSFDELTWAQSSVRMPLAELANTYSAVPYRHDRVDANRFDWGGQNYLLPDILSTGGICVDQAYFATQCAKARGVPSMIFRGSGLDGRHAWFGFLDGNRRWQLDAGRIAEQKLITGLAHNPQTWGDLSDHELRFLSDGFRMAPRFYQAQVHEAFARCFLDTGDAVSARKAARLAVNYESRHVTAWEVLLLALEREGAPAKTTEVALREAALAFQQYPDLNLRYGLLLTKSLRTRGETSAADHEERVLARKHQGARADLSFEQAMSELTRAMETQPSFEQMRLFRSVVDQFGPGSGIAFFDAVVRPFVSHLAVAGKQAEATRALGHARLVLAPTPDSQLDREMSELARRHRL